MVVYTALEDAKYACANRKGSLLAALTIVAVFVAMQFAADAAGTQEALAFWKSTIDPFLKAATLAVAVAVWLGEVHEDRKNDLPKKLSVDFEYQGHVVMRCRLADLASAADMRALAQQIGSQMVKEKDGRPGQLNFNVPCIRQTGGSEEKGADGRRHVHYRLHFYLIKLPARIENDPKFDPRTECLLWEPPFPPEPVTVTLDLIQEPSAQ